MNEKPLSESEKMDRTNDTLRRMLKTPPRPHKKREPSKLSPRRGSNEKANQKDNRP